MFHTDQDDPSSSDDEGMPYTRPVKFKAAHSFKGPFDFDQIKVVQDLSGEHMVRLLESSIFGLILINVLIKWFFLSGGCLDNEVLSLRAAAGNSRSR